MTIRQSARAGELDLTVHVPENARPVVAFAGSELAGYISRISGARTVVRSAAALSGLDALVLGSVTGAPVQNLGGEKAGFRVRSDRRCVVLSGANPRAVLDAVYALLASWGCRWSPHGAGEEQLPHLSTFPPPAVSISARPRFAATGYAADLMTWHASEPALYRERLVEDAALIDWMGKTGASRFLYIRHPADELLTVPELQDDLNRRGIAVELGGHVIPALVPRDLFAVHPEYFPCGPDGVRNSNGNICTAQPAALDTARRNAVDWARAHPGVAGFHIWGADLWQGGWCLCAECSGVSVQDQSLALCNAVARGLRDAGIACPVYYLAYHDTIEPIGKLVPDSTVWVEFAPRERCYGHRLDDPQCRTNRRYAVALEEYAKRFDGRVRVFEYYADAILFCGCAVPLTAVIEGDLAYYARLGVPEITMLQFGAVSRLAYPTNFVAFAAAAAAGGETGAAMTGYCRRFGAAAPALGTALAEVEAAMGQVVRYGDVRRPPRAPDAAERVRSRAAAAVAVMDRIVTRLATAGGSPADEVREILRYTREVLAGVEARCDGPDGAARANAHYLKAAERARRWSRDAAGVWGTVDLPRLHEFYEVVFPQL